jgi:hypothetical protein
VEYVTFVSMTEEKAEQEASKQNSLLAQKFRLV